MKGKPIEFLGEELRRLVGRGATPERLSAARYLREALYSGGDALNPREVGYVMRRNLIAGIESMTGRHEFYGVWIEAPQQTGRAYRLLFEIEGIGQPAPWRRARAIQALKLFKLERTWRVPDGPEWRFMLILAEHLCR